MANRRMFSMKIVGSDAFLDMPPTTRELYFQFGMYADDDGFISPRKIMRMTGSSEDDLKVLIAKRFVLPFDNGIIVIKHWKMNNELKKDRYNPTQYTEQKSILFLKENGAYTLDKEQGINLSNIECIQNGNIMEPQVRLGKDRLDKIKEDISFSKKKKPFYRGEEMRKKNGVWFVIPKEGGDWLEFADKETEIEWK